MTLDLDTRELDYALKMVVRKTDREMPEAIDRAMASVLYRNKVNVIRKTIRTTKAKIKRELTRDKGRLVAALAQKSLKAKGQKVTLDNVTREMNAILARRYKSVRYLVAGWAKPARMFGATRIKPVSSKSIAGKSSGKKASKAKTFAEATNEVAAVLADQGAHNQAFDTMQKAVNFEARFLIAYVEKKLNRIMKPYEPGVTNG